MKLPKLFAAAVFGLLVWSGFTWGFGDVASAQVTCGVSPIGVDTQADLNAAISCFNAAAPGTTTTITFTGNIEMTDRATALSNTSATVVIDGGGYTLSAGAAFPGAASHRSLLFMSDGILEMRDLTVAGGSSAGLEVEGGSATITGSTLTANRQGVLLYSSEPAVIANSTFTGNIGAGISAGGNPDFASLTVRSSTIVDNGGQGIVFNPAPGSSASLTIEDSLLAGNFEGEQCSGPVTDGGGNIVAGDTCGTIPDTPGLDTTYASALADNGCTAPCTQTIALLGGSPAVDAAGSCTVDKDQRGVDRTPGKCDAGAFELGDCSGSAYVVEVEEELNFAIACYNRATADTTTTVTFAGTVEMTTVATHINNDTGAILMIDGAGHALEAGSAFQAGRNLLRMDAGRLVLDRVTVSGATNSGLSASAGFVLITGSTFNANTRGVSASGASVLVANSTITGNTFEGLIAGPLSVRSSTIVDNGGYGIRSLSSSTIEGSLIAGNNGNDDGSECDAPIEDGGGNIVDDASCGPIPATPAVVGTYADALADNGCTTPCTQTLALSALSPAIDAAGGCVYAQDQRGFDRTPGKCDAGAFEFGDCGSQYVVRTEAELNFAIGCYNSAAADTTTTITFIGDIEMAAMATRVENTTTASLVVQGNGFTLSAATGFADLTHILSQSGGDLTVDRLTLADGRQFGAALHVTGGQTSIMNSTFLNNFVGLAVESTVTIHVAVTNSTFASNGIGIFAAGPTIVRSTTIVGSETSALDTLDGLVVTVSDSLLAGTLSDNPECSNDMATDGGGNIVEDDSCFGAGTGTPGVANSYAPSLADNGCTAPCTQTIALLPGSPAVDAAASCTSAKDQRGVDRTPGKCDAGAFELGDCAPLFNVDTEAELNLAIGCYNIAAADTTTTITFIGDIEMAVGALSIDNPTNAALVVDGAGYALSAADDFPRDIELLAMTDGTLQLNDLTVTGDGSRSIGIRVTGGAATITKSTFTSNYIAMYANSSAPVVVENTTVAGNVRGGIFVESGVAVTVRSSTIVNNGTGIRTFDGRTITIEGSLIAGNGGECISMVTNGGGNIVEDDTCGTVPATPGVAGTYAGALAHNGCTAPCTQTIALLAGSPAIDAAGSCGVDEDQRGEDRSPSTCDAGAFEVGDIDADGDGFDGPLGDAADCDDTKSAVFPGADEVPYDGIDQDCNGSDLVDVDGDGFTAAQATGGTPDCDDTDGSVNPDADEVAGDGIDQDCNGSDLVIALCAGRPVTINMNTNGGNGTGTAGDDVILGTPGPDVIDGLQGSDTICGEGGNDTINGGAGDFRDFLYGGPGDDTINGGFGIDYIFGQDGDDTLDGDGGSDRMYGGPDNDLMLGDSGADRMFGGDGDDEMRGMGGQDQMWGGPGNDFMQGNFQSDNMFGGPGNDTMFGAGGKDTMFGDAGDDLLRGGDNTDFLDGGADIDEANGGRGRDRPLTQPSVRAGNGRYFGGSGCIAETILNCQATP